MKKENHLLQIVLFGLILCLVSTLVYTKAYSAQKERILEKEIKNYRTVAEKLLERRLMVMNDFMYGKTGYDETVNELKTFEKGQCLAWDLEFLKEIKDNPTAYARVLGLDIQEVQVIETRQDNFKLTLNISWAIEDFETNIIEEGIYEVVIGTEEEGRYNLIKFDALN